MSKPIYEDVRRRCVTCGGEIPSTRTISNFCSATCFDANRYKDKVVRKFVTRSGYSREQYHKQK